ncbi:uncharacterized protein LOC125381000 [Haliotis rufescens]|uniref:uncharacterized protein LOC125381000 n=1 Tax=Haliotis rufescens TaxID=6454 RepID=UPI00201EBD84|nr:uncharacterized protein LOC125381000 [Haliotis rufescens]
MELVCMDFLTLEPSKGGQQYVLVITDHFTRYAQAYPCRNTSAKTTADLFFNNFVIHYGLPKRIHSDKGANFVGKLMTELCLLLGIDKSSTTPYHPMGNGMCERFNRTLCDMLGTLEPDAKRDWKAHVGPLVHAYNCIRHESTGHSPFFLMFGRCPRLPVDLAFGLDIQPSKPKSLQQYTKSLRERLQEGYHLASQNSKEAQQDQKTYFDKKARAAIIETGDRVLVKTVAFEGRHKLADRWEGDIYTVLRQPNPSIPVYVVGKENGEGRKRVLHRNLLLPIGALPVPDPPAPEPPRPIPKPRISKRLAIPVKEPEDDESDIYFPSSEPSVSAADTADRPTEARAEVEDSALDEDDLVGDAVGSQPDQPEDISAEVDPAAEEISDVETTDADPGAAPEEPANVEDDPELAEDVPAQQPRRSGRTRTQPRWMSSGEYVMSAVPHPDWRNRAEYLSSLINAGVLANDSTDVQNAFLSLVLGR